MSIQSALQAGVSGLGAQSRRFASIADNISNAQTSGYKRSAVDFTTQVADAVNRSAYAAGGVNTLVRRTVDQAGSIETASRPTDLAINGDGFFVVRADIPANEIDEPLLLTRVGSSALDANGFLRLDNGYYLQGMPLDKDGNLTSQLPQAIQLDGQPSSPKPSQNVTFKDNLPASLSSEAEWGSSLETAVTYVDELGSSKTLRFVWTSGGTTDMEPAPDEGTIPAANTWNLKIYDGTAEAPLYNQNIAFGATGDGAGLPVDRAADGTLTLTLDADDTVSRQEMTVTLDLTQFDFNYAPTFSTDGVAASDFSNIDVGEDGTVYAVFENGTREPRFRLMMADVANPSGLEPLAGDAYAITIESGPLLRRFAGETGMGTIRNYAVEGSNVDIADELTSMITTQRAYSANASIVTTSDEMLQELTNLKR